MAYTNTARLQLDNDKNIKAMTNQVFSESVSFKACYGDCSTTYAAQHDAVINLVCDVNSLQITMTTPTTNFRQIGTIATPPVPIPFEISSVASTANEAECPY